MSPPLLTYPQSRSSYGTETRPSPASPFSFGTKAEAPFPAAGVTLQATLPKEPRCPSRFALSQRPRLRIAAFAFPLAQPPISFPFFWMSEYPPLSL